MTSTITDGIVNHSELTQNAKGGTELLIDRLVGHLNKDYLEGIQIHVSRYDPENVSSNHKQVLWVHDLANDPAVEHLKDGGWEKFDMIVFVSHWQRQMYNLFLGVPYNSRTIVIQNGIDEIKGAKPELHNPDKVRFIYHTTPHRGLHLLVAAAEELGKEYDNFEIDVYSSFELYGWGERDKQFKPLFDHMDRLPFINNMGAVPHQEIIEKLPTYDIFAYPSIWPETSCMCLMEAMQAGLICLHSSLGALPETSCRSTLMYSFVEDTHAHLDQFYSSMKQLIPAAAELKEIAFDAAESDHVQTFTFSRRAAEEWEQILTYLKNSHGKS